MKTFARLVENLDGTTKTNEKVAFLADYFVEADEQDKLWTIALFTGRRPRRAVKTTQLRSWLAEVSGIPLWLVEESYYVVGDLAETLALLLPSPGKVQNSRSLSEWMEFLVDLHNQTDDDKKRRIKAAWLELGSGERFVFNKLITGGFRLGVSQRLLIRALAVYMGKEANTIAHRLMGNWTPETTSWYTLIEEENVLDDISRPYPFFLAYAMENNPEEWGDISDWQAEWKWDGIRAQLIKRKGEWFLWSRGEELMTDRFPDLAEMAQSIPDGTVLDGELLPVKDGKILPFHILQTRIGRKNVSRKMLQEVPVMIMVYDIMEFEGNDVRNLPLMERRNLLQKIVEETDEPNILLLSEILEAGDWKTLGRNRNKARAMDAEGLMLKRKTSVYGVGRKRGDWWKWKVDPFTVDAVMIYAQQGHGRRANLFTDYTFAVWEGEKLVPFAKAYSGLTDAEITEVDRFVRKNTLEKFGPVRSVSAELVFEIGFEGISRSGRHKSGIAVRFPRILRWRKEKKPAEADHLWSLIQLLD